MALTMLNSDKAPGRCKAEQDGAAFSTLHSFGDVNDGSFPGNDLFKGTNGAFYGTTSSGGATGNGTVFRLNQDGSGYNVVYSFSPRDYALGPVWLVQGSDGALYGTAANLDVVFRVASDGSGCQVVFSSFISPSTEGSAPSALVHGSDGVLYGLTSRGGTNDGGIAFKINLDGTGYGLLHTFDGGESPGALLQGMDGALYGTAANGGTNGLGSVFKLGRDGSSYTVLYSFGAWGANDGQWPGALVQGNDGLLYGNSDTGVFRLNTDGGEFSLVQFTFADSALLPLRRSHGGERWVSIRHG